MRRNEKELIQGIKNADNPKKTNGLRLKMIFKVGVRYFIPTNFAINDGLVNGAIGTLMEIDLDHQDIHSSSNDSILIVVYDP